MHRPTKPARPQYVEVRGPSGRLYALYDPARQLIEFKRGSQTETIDLTAYQRPAPANECPS